MAGTARRLAEARGYSLSDHFAVYGLLDVHSCHSRAGVVAVREKRRVDLGILRDIAADLRICACAGTAFDRR